MADSTTTDPRDAEIARLRGHRRGADGRYLCCKHCADDSVHDVEPDGHDGPCQSCDDPATLLRERAEAAEAALAEERAKVARVEALADELAATVALLLYDAHPVYGSTATWHGGIGGAAMTQGCSFIDPPPDADWLALGMPSMPLREWIDHRGDFDLDGAKDRMRAKFRAALSPTETGEPTSTEGEMT